jgi:hypothetical protein
MNSKFITSPNSKCKEENSRSQFKNETVSYLTPYLPFRVNPFRVNPSP